MTPLGALLPDDRPDRILEDPVLRGPDRWLYRAARVEPVTRA